MLFSNLFQALKNLRIRVKAPTWLSWKKTSKLHQQHLSVLFFPVFPTTGCLIVNNISSVVEFQRWWVLKTKIFVQESRFFFKSIDELWFIKKCQNCTFKVNFRCQKSTEFFQKKLRLRPNILSKRLGGRSLSRSIKSFGLGLLTD